MKASSQYRMDTPTLGIVSLSDGHRIPIIIPRDAVVTVVGMPNDDRMIDVVWQGSTATIFAQDLAARGIKVESAGA
jgi:hypothetical protein